MRKYNGKGGVSPSEFRGFFVGAVFINGVLDGTVSLRVGIRTLGLLPPFLACG